MTSISSKRGRHQGGQRALRQRSYPSSIRAYQTFQRPFVYTPGDNEWTDCHRVNNGRYDPLERLGFLRSVFFPQVGQTTGGHVRPVRSQAAEGGAYSEFVENVMFQRQSVMFATVHVVGSNNDLEPWLGISPTDSCTSPRPDRIAEFERRQAAALAWLDEVFAAAADTKGVFLLIQANPYNLPSNPQLCPSGFKAFLDRLEARATQYAKPVMPAHGDDHFFFVASRCQTCSFRECKRTVKGSFTGSRCTWIQSRAGCSPSNRRL